MKTISVGMGLYRRAVGGTIGHDGSGSRVVRRGSKPPTMYRARVFDLKNSIVIESFANIYFKNLDIFSIVIEFLTTEELDS